MIFFQRENILKLATVILITVSTAIFFMTGMHKYLTLEFIKTSQAGFQQVYANHPLMVITLFVAFYITAIALNLPGATVLGLAAGALFGTVTGTVIISFASSIGATLACMLSRYLLQEWVQKKFEARLKKINEGIKKEGAFYLFSIRLIPIFPFFIINMVMGLTRMPIWTFYWVSQLGMLPATAFYVNAGSQIARLDSLEGIVSPQLVFSLALLGLFPVVARKTLNWYRTRLAFRSKDASLQKVQQGCSCSEGKRLASIGSHENGIEPHCSSDGVHENGIKPHCSSDGVHENGIKPHCSSDRVHENGIEPHCPSSKSLVQAIGHINSGCTNCGACKSQCAFLQEYGTPGEILGHYDFSRAADQKIVFECSVCNLCCSVCPEKLEPGKLFAAVRKEAIKADNVDLSRYRTILNYEKRGNSPLFSYYGLPQGCDTIFFPGCSLPGTRPETTWQIFTRLQQSIPEIGIVLDCCTKPSHDLGRHNYFELMFGEMRKYLVENGVRKILVACPNCYRLFKDYGKELEVRTVYELLADNMPPGTMPDDINPAPIDIGSIPAGDMSPGAIVTGAISSGDMNDGDMNLDGISAAALTGELAIHDPCPLRDDSSVQDAVRAILTRMGFTVAEMKHRRKRTLCCGEGGSVGFIRPELARKWADVRKKEADGRKIVTYCAGCASYLNRVTPTLHITDIVFSTQKALNGELVAAKAPFTYINRLKLKQRFKNNLNTAVQRV
ncbi:MAG: VTT domain-containing protein, partial [Desulfamplus sp.]|nr:VTT domain-containing protein [Desulfamplus sp.]